MRHLLTEPQWAQEVRVPGRGGWGHSTGGRDRTQKAGILLGRRASCGEYGSAECSNGKKSARGARALGAGFGCGRSEGTARDVLSRQARSGLLQLMWCHVGGAIGSGFLEKESGHSSLRGGDVGAVAECTARPEARTRGLLPAR